MTNFYLDEMTLTIRMYVNDASISAILRTSKISNRHGQCNRTHMDVSHARERVVTVYSTTHSDITAI